MDPKLKRSLIALVLGLVACNVPSSIVPSDSPPASGAVPTKASAPTARAENPEHRIGVRANNGVGEFYDRLTGEKFVARGANYVFVPRGSGYTNTLLAVGTYDPQRTRADFAHLAGLGYNSVRVFLDQCNRGPACIGRAGASGLNPAYLDNIADMLLAARETGIYILFTSNDLPDEGGYSEEANFGSGGDFAGYRNSYYLRPQSISATRRYWRDLLNGLGERNPAFDAVLGWQLLNEQWMFRDQPPLSLTSGTVQTTTGSYDMGDPQQKKQMVSEGLIYYIAQMKEEILLHDPTALVTMGFFVPELVAPDWYVDTAPLLKGSDLDFFDFHAYPGPLSLQAHAAGFGMLGYAARPIIMGEYGAFRHIYADAQTAGRVTTNWVAESCDLGFDGWLYWTYYPADASAGDRTWGLVDENDYLLELLSPHNQPDPCAPAEQAGGNLAYSKAARASNSLPDQPAGQAVDGDPATSWSAGASPEQWLEIDLGAPATISAIRLTVAQYPAGNTVHQIWARGPGDNLKKIFEFSGNTTDNQVLEFRPAPPAAGIQFIRILTVSSPSWVAWREIEVIAK
jgi:hypothetical protein